MELEHWNLVWQLLWLCTMWNCEETAVRSPLSPKSAVSLIFSLETFDNSNMSHIKNNCLGSKQIREIFIKKSLSQMIKNCLIWQKKTKKIRWETVVWAKMAVPPLSSQFHIVPLKINCHAKFQCCNSFFSWVPLPFSFSFKKCHNHLPLWKTYLGTYFNLQIR